MKSRRLKVEEELRLSVRRPHREPARFPKVRLQGQWLAAAGFPPNSHLTVTVIARGVLELRAVEAPEALRARLGGAYEAASLALDRILGSEAGHGR
jgi:hypothetical protein